MSMNIPTIQVDAGTVTYGINVFHDGSADLTPGTVFNANLPARIVPNVNGNSPLYGPGSARYEITGVTYKANGKDPAPVAIDPKTYIDNYGYIHVGPSNMPKTNAGSYTITFKAIYSYIDPSTGDVKSYETNNLKIMPMLTGIDLFQDRATAITYQPQPGTNG